LKRSRLAVRAARSPWFPANWRSTVNLFHILAVDYAHLKTVAEGRSVDAMGHAILWYTYPAIEFLRQLDFSRSSIFEYGCGNSTIFWSSIASEVVSVEDDESWHGKMAARVPPNCRLLLQPDLDRFVEVIDGFDKFDVVIVDGPARGRTRLKCARAALTHLAHGGMIILDNSDWLPQSSTVLREAGLLQVDMTGFSPINSFTGTTSFFFDRRWQFSSKGDRRPVPGIGGRMQNWEARTTAAGKVLRCGKDVLYDVVGETQLQIDLNGLRRTFRIAAYAMEDGNRALAILDDDQQRVLLASHKSQSGAWPGPGRVLEQEVERIRTMSPATFTEFINTHSSRRYRL